MKKRVFTIFLLIAILLVACSNTDDSSQVAEPVATAVVEGQEPLDPAAETTGTQDGPYTTADDPCKPFNLMAQSLVTPYPGLPPVTDDDWIVGPDDAAVTFMVYSEPQCPYCAQLEPLLNDIQAQYPNDVRLVYRHRPFPESFHDKSILASQAMEAAGKQGKFVEFKNFLFEQQSVWAPVPKNDFDAWLEDTLANFEIEPTQFFKDMYSNEIVDKIDAAAQSANNLGINGTPTLLINGYSWTENERGLEIFSIYVQLIKNQVNEYNSCAPTVIQDGKEYSAIISTTKGDIAVDLFAESAPYAVNSFVFLAQEGWYDEHPFIATNEFALTGDPSDTGYGGPGYAYLDEINPDLSFDDPGKLATFSLGPGINGSSFFINKTDLEGTQNRTIFGEVTEGMDVVNALELRENIFSPATDRILNVTIIEK
jgi:cyclophilin family peptidyl-prolyl cis-trans isomerase/protein-disulfide isomerase